VEQHISQIGSNPKGAIVTENTPQTDLSDNAASGIAYITFIPAIIFLATAPYNQKPLIRFHSWQSIFLTIAYVVVRIVLIILGHFPFLGLIFGLVGVLIGLGFFILWLIVLIKTFNGQMFKIPVIGDFAEKQAKS
jgi:uncharacterized membrane protein